MEAGYTMESCSAGQSGSRQSGSGQSGSRQSGSRRQAFGRNDLFDCIELRDFHYYIVDCPRQVRLELPESTSGPGRLYSLFAGTYTIQPGTINGRRWYKQEGSGIGFGFVVSAFGSSFGRIWYDGGRWSVGSSWSTETECRSSGDYDCIFYSYEEDECPNWTNSNSWKYYVRSARSWYDTGRSMEIVSAS